MGINKPSGGKIYLDGEDVTDLGITGRAARGVENTIRAVGQLARVGMEQTDKEIIQLMLDPAPEDKDAP